MFEPHLRKRTNSNKSQIKHKIDDNLSFSNYNEIGKPLKKQLSINNIICVFCILLSLIAFSLICLFALFIYKESKLPEPIIISHSQFILEPVTFYLNNNFTKTLQNQRIIVNNGYIIKIQSSNDKISEEYNNYKVFSLPNIHDIEWFILPSFIDSYTFFPELNTKYYKEYFNLLYLSKGITTIIGNSIDFTNNFSVSSYSCLYILNNNHLLSINNLFKYSISINYILYNNNDCNYIINSLRQYDNISCITLFYDDSLSNTCLSSIYSYCTLNNISIFILYENNNEILQNSSNIYTIPLLESRYNENNCNKNYNTIKYIHSTIWKYFWDDYSCFQYLNINEQSNTIRKKDKNNNNLLIGSNSIVSINNIPGYTYHEEIKRYLYDLNYSIKDIWSFATTNPLQSNLDNIDNIYNTNNRIKENIKANFLLYKGDPTESIDNFNNLQIRAVVSNGIIVWKKYIDKALKDYEDYYSRKVVQFLINLY